MNWYKVASIRYFRVHTPHGSFVARCLSDDCNLKSRFPDMTGADEITRDDALHHERTDTEGGCIHCVAKSRLERLKDRHYPDDAIDELDDEGLERRKSFIDFLGV